MFAKIFNWLTNRPDIDAVYSPEYREAHGIECVLIDNEGE